MRLMTLIPHWIFLSVTILVAGAAAAFAADQPGHGASEAVFFVQLVVLMLVGGCSGKSCSGCGSPR